MIYPVPSDLYVEIASRLVEAIGAENYFSGSLLFACGDVECRLTASVIVYRRTERFPEGPCEVIFDLVPVWWEFHTCRDGAELLNDFSFSTLRAYL